MVSLLDTLREQHPQSPAAIEAEEFGVGYTIRRACEAGKHPKFMGIPLEEWAHYPNLVDLYFVGDGKLIPVVGDP